MKAGLRRFTIGVAVSPEALTAVARRGDDVHVVRVDVQRDGGADAVRAAVAALRARLDAACGAATPGAAVHMALLPPLAESRLLQLPPLRPHEAAAVVRRDAARYFVGVPLPAVANVQRRSAALPRASAPAPGAPVLAAAAGAATLDALHGAVAAAGWRTAGVTSALAAWLAAARHGVRPELRASLRCVIAADAGMAHVLRVRDGEPDALRRVPLDAHADIIEAAGEPGAAVLFAEPGTRAALAAALSAAGWTVAPLQHNAAEAAARFTHAATLPLSSVSAELDRTRRERRLALRLAAATVMLLLGSAAAELWGARRELDAVRAQRAELRADVAPLLALRDSADALQLAVRSVEDAAASAPRWTAALFDLAMLLPPETHLTRLHTSGDTVTVEVEGTRAGAALQALRTASSLRDARLLGAVDRELSDGTTATERFRITARLERATAPAAARTAAGRAP